MYFEINFLCVSCKESKLGYVSCKYVPWKIFEQTCTGMLYLHIFLIEMHEIDTVAEVYLEPFQTYMIRIFWETC